MKTITWTASVVTVQLALGIVVWLGGGLTSAAELDFVADVRPILQQHCYTCHGPDQQKSGLRLDIKSEAFRGGDGYGPSIVPGQIEASPLIELVRGQDDDSRMPPEGSPLSSQEIATLVKWVEHGAVWPDGVDLAQLDDPSQHWAFQPAQSPDVPLVPSDHWSREPLDTFVLRKLRQAGLHPADEATRLVWLRRVSLDLQGLPPTPTEINLFLSDRGSDAYQRVVDRLLASPRYGERWAQHWLDVVRYADTDGFEVNTPRPNAWPYRDYVIRAFNDDTPYDQFIREQLAGDLMQQDAATGFLVTAAALLPGQIGQDDVSKRLARQDELAEIVINTGEAFLGLSVGCARCHDHKFDPVTQRDYYAMQAFFSGVHFGERPWVAGVQNGLAPEVEAVFAGNFSSPEPTFFLRRGDPEQPEDQLAPAVVAALGQLELPADASESQRRRTLAEWIANSSNPLTARVIVNRLWQWHFGMGLVETSSDFGRNGMPPTHPELLDWLATELVRSGWSIKRLQRRIVLSATYRQSNQIDRQALAQDAGVRLWWRFPIRRMEAETLRDSILFVSGRLNFQTGGPGFDLFQSRGGLNGFPPIESFSGDGLRRMIYAHKIRMERESVFGAFDCPDAGQSTARRRQSTTPIQALNLFNSRFTLDQCIAFAQRVEDEVGSLAAPQIARVFELAYGRQPEDQEMHESRQLVEQQGLAALCRVVLNSNEFLFVP